MRILIYCINYFPELTGIGKYSGEMTQWLVERGHEVRVVTALPYYPEWKIWNGYSTNYKIEKESDHLIVYRCPLWVPKKPSGLKRILHLASFALASLPVLVFQLFWKPELVFVTEPPVFCAPGAWLIARLSKAKAWLHIHDFEVDAAFDLNILPSGKIKNIILIFESLLLKRFDRVSTISNKMIDKLKSKGVCSTQSAFFPNWADTDTLYPLGCLSPFRKELGISDETLVCLYSGNMGEKQGLEILIETARLLADEPFIHFVLCGNGAVKESLFESGKNLPNISWLPLQPKERLNDLLNLADIHLLIQKANAADLVMPSKLTGMLASGKPIIATVKPCTEIAQILEKCGICIAPEDANLLKKAITELASNKALQTLLGQESRRYAVEHLSRDAVLSEFEAMLNP